MTEQTSASGDIDPIEIIYYDSTRLGFLLVGFLLTAPIVLLLISLGVRWWLAPLLTAPAAVAVSYWSMPRRRLRLGQDYLGMREGRRPEVLIALRDIGEIERVWVLRAGYHLEFRTEEASITLLGLGDFSRPFLHEIGARLSRTASPQLRIGLVEQDLLGLRD